MEGSDIKLDVEQQARAVALERQVIDDPYWAASAIVWQRDQLADRHAERVREIDAHTERVAGLEAEIDRLRAENADLRAENADLRADLVWLSRRARRWDGTPESICRAVRSAREEARDGVS